MGIEEIKDLIYEVCEEFRNEIGEFTYCDRELTDEEIERLFKNKTLIEVL